MVRERCFYCGNAKGPFEEDHVVPFARGGTSLPRNLVLACKGCNAQKSDRLPSEWRADLDQRVYDLENMLLEWHQTVDARRRVGSSIYPGVIVLLDCYSNPAIVEVLDGRGIRVRRCDFDEDAKRAIPLSDVASRWFAWSVIKRATIAAVDEKEALRSLFEEAAADASVYVAPSLADRLLMPRTRRQ